jgi:hypothetical protein
VKILINILPVLCLAACSTTHSSDPSSLFFEIPEGSTLTLNQQLEIPPLSTHALIQAGRSLAENEKNEYEINCRFEVKGFGPRTIEPETFRIRRTENGQEWFSYEVIMRFYTELYLESDKGSDVIKLECQQWGDGIDRNFTVAEMTTALGNVFTFNYNKAE